MSLQVKTPELSYGNETFNQGLTNGIAWYHTGELAYRAPTADLIVQFIKNNMLEPEFEEWKYDDELLTRHAGFLIGWVIGEYI